ncbi:M20/M25/M40 family metallo-hydrolase, partial [Staphylococcus simulans]|uniref:M20/M25/M40 family metallo-hydrolase n=1 Tax=Staphylococcus simulans TaxID=1286 RepID=UPI000E67A2C2
TSGYPRVSPSGRVDPVPNTVNVEPGEVSLSIDCRHNNQEALNDYAKTIDDCIRTVSEQEGVEYDINLWMDEAPTMMDESLVKVVEQAAEQVVGSNDSKMMPSGAGHDSQIFAKYIPTAMLFVPSINGVSHNVTEETNIEDLVKGIEVLK